MTIEKLFHRIKDQSGRSLLEILGVIAIMGVLSIVGIYGVEYALEKDRENETLNRFSKVVAGARTSRILQNHGENTKYDDNGNVRPDFVPQIVDMHDVISNIGDDIYVIKAGDNITDSYIVAPLEGPVKDGSEQPVEIYVTVQTPEAFTVHANNLTMDACMKIVRANNLGYTFTYEGAEPTDLWRVPAAVQTLESARALCEKVTGVSSSGKQAYFINPFIKNAYAQSAKGGSLVLWFGPYECIGTNCKPPVCAGAECCCETVGTKVQLKNPAPVGCTAEPGIPCVSCATADSDNICRSQFGTACTPTCASTTMCPSNAPYYCGGSTCCLNANDCGDTEGTCKSGVTPGAKCTDPKRPISCGTNCCSEDESCINGKCEPAVCGTGETACLLNNKFSGKCCGPNEECCGTTCCPDSQGLYCADPNASRCERRGDPATDCPGGNQDMQSCILNGKPTGKCCPFDAQCCGSICCNIGTSCADPINSICKPIVGPTPDPEDICAEKCPQGGQLYDNNGEQDCCCTGSDMVLIQI